MLRSEIAYHWGRVKAGASRPDATRGYGLDSAKSTAQPLPYGRHGVSTANDRPTTHRHEPLR